ncbi:MAG: protease modulator HflC [Myxococcota bacterium]
MKGSTVLGVIVAALAILLFYASTYTVDEGEQVLITRFGKIQGKASTEPGLHFKAPFADSVLRFDKRWLEWDGDPNQIPTRDKKYIWVDTYARWRISDPKRFYERLRDEVGAQSRLDDIIDGEIRNVIASHDLIEIVRESNREFAKEAAGDETTQNPDEFRVKLGREELQKLVLEKAGAVMPDYGIELADVQVKRINYVQSVQVKVFERMISERKRIAERYRSEGKGKSAEIRGKIDRELKTIESEAYRKAVTVRGEGDAEATVIYARGYSRDPDFYRFLESLATYKATIDEDMTLVLSTDAQVYQFLKGIGEVPESVRLRAKALLEADLKEQEKKKEAEEKEGDREAEGDAKPDGAPPAAPSPAPTPTPAAAPASP